MSSHPSEGAECSERGGLVFAEQDVFCGGTERQFVLRSALGDGAADIHRMQFECIKVDMAINGWTAAPVLICEEVDGIKGEVRHGVCCPQYDGVFYGDLLVAAAIEVGIKPKVLEVVEGDLIEALDGIRRGGGITEQKLVDCFVGREYPCMEYLAALKAGCCEFAGCSERDQTDMLARMAGVALPEGAPLASVMGLVLSAAASSEALSKRLFSSTGPVVELFASRPQAGPSMLTEESVNAKRRIRMGQHMCAVSNHILMFSLTDPVFAGMGGDKGRVGEHMLRDYLHHLDKYEAQDARYVRDCKLAGLMAGVDTGRAGQGDNGLDLG